MATRQRPPEYGLSWQVVPEMPPEMFTDASSPGTERAFTAMIGMKKIDIAELEKAFRG